MTVLLQADLTVTSDGEIAPRENTASRTTRSNTFSEGASGGNGASGGKGTSGGMPVFRSQSGALMTLPGGILLALDKTWSNAETDAFFERNGIKPARVSGLGYVANGFFVETEPGFPSLDLANSLAAQDGVRIATPNWQRELVAE